MTRIVRFEEINGDLVLRVPADVAARLKFVTGDQVVLTDAANRLTVEPLDDDRHKQLQILDCIFKEEDAVLAALAR